MSLLHFQCRHRYESGFTLDTAFELPGPRSAIFGPSGSGKSTCLALIAGLLRPGRGCICLGDRTLVDSSSRTWLPPHRRRVGLVFQDHLLFPHMSVRRNIRYGMAGGGRTGIGFDDLLDVLDLADLLDRYPGQISGGQRQRVALARALLSDPELLMMDEPLTGLDEQLRDRVLSYLQQVQQRWETPMLLVSHDQVAVRRLAADVVVLENGCVVEQGPVAATLDHATMQTMAEHPGPINLLRVEPVERAGDHAVGRVGGQAIYLPRAVADLAATHVRFSPSDVTLSGDPAALLSVRNRLRGTVSEIVPVDGGSTVFVAIDVGQPLWAQVTPAAVTELNLAAGVEIHCLIKATAIHPVA